MSAAARTTPRASPSLAKQIAGVKDQFLCTGQRPTLSAVPNEYRELLWCWTRTSNREGCAEAPTYPVVESRQSLLLAIRQELLKGRTLVQDVIVEDAITRRAALIK